MTPLTGNIVPITAVVKVDARVTDVAGNMMVDTSIVIFNLITGKSSSHSGRSFTDAVTDIYIIVGAESEKLNSENDGFMWIGNSNLKEAVEVHLVSGNGERILGGRGAGIKEVVEGRVEGRDIYFKTDTKGGTAYAVLMSSVGKLQRSYNGKNSSAILWRNEVVLLAPGEFNVVIGAGVLTSQGLV